MPKQNGGRIKNRYLEPIRDLVLRERDNGSPIPINMLINFISKDIEKGECHFQVAHSFIHKTFRTHLYEIDPTLWEAMKTNKANYMRMKQTITWDQGHTTLITTPSNNAKIATQPFYNQPTKIKENIDGHNPSPSNHSVDNGGGRQSIVLKGWLQERPHVLPHVINVCDSVGLKGSHHPSTPNAEGRILAAEGSYNTNHCVNVNAVKYLKQQFAKDLDVESEFSHRHKSNSDTVWRYQYGTGCGLQTSGVNPWYVYYMPLFMYTFTLSIHHIIIHHIISYMYSLQSFCY